MCHFGCHFSFSLFPFPSSVYNSLSFFFLSLSLLFFLSLSISISLYLSISVFSLSLFSLCLHFSLSFARSLSLSLLLLLFVNLSKNLLSLLQKCLACRGGRKEGKEDIGIFWATIRDGSEKQHNGGSSGREAKSSGSC